METKKNPKANLENKRGLFFMIGLVVALLFVLAAFEWKTYASGPNSLGQLQADDTEEEIIPITQQQKPPPPPPPPPPPQEILKIVEDDKEIENEVEVQDAEADQQTEVFEQPEEVIDEPSVFVVVEDMPVFPGCENAGSKQKKEECTGNKIYSFIQENTKYPAMAKDAGISGTVFIRYIIDENGKVSNVSILRGVSGGKALDDEAVRVIKSLPKMTPGKQRGQSVRVQYNVPVKFNLR